jgi:hypothetical protein
MVEWGWRDMKARSGNEDEELGGAVLEVMLSKHCWVFIGLKS